MSQIPPKLEGVVEVSPAAGLLLGCEAVALTWLFAPAQQKVYEARWALRFKQASERHCISTDVKPGSATK